MRGGATIDFRKPILTYRKTIITIFLLLAVLGGIAQFGVKVNYNMSSYLPDSAPSTLALKEMEKEFSDPLGNTRIMVSDVSIQEALHYKKQIAEIPSVTSIMWLDDIMDLRIPIEMADPETVESYYKNKNALFMISVEDGKEIEATNAIYDIIGEENAMMGEALNTAIAQQMTGEETLNATILLVPIIIIILILSTTSWIEPVFFLTAIGVSVLINMGSNIFIGEISFMSNSVAPILQLAVSLDYAIFLLHSFRDARKTIPDPKEAMAKAMKKSFNTITSSASTTFFGFMALASMKFEIGADLGLNLVKGILLSFISVMVFLPALTVQFHRLIDKTEHKPFVPDRYKVGKFFLKFRIPAVLLILIIIYPAFLAQSNTNFLYGMGDHPADTRAGIDAVTIEEEFGKYMPMVLLVPKDDLVLEARLVDDLEKLSDVQSVVSYTNTVGLAIPDQFLEEEDRATFFSDNYSRIIVNTNMEAESEAAFSLVENVRNLSEKYYGDEYYALGENVTLYDMKEIIEKDNILVNSLTIITIGLILAISFRSLSIPIVLLFTIQASVWINLAIPYFTGDYLVYIGYLIISIIQLAATVDYAILFADDFKNNRTHMPALEAITKTINEKIFSITVPASILSSVGFILSWTSTDPIISSIGLLLGRGTLLAYVLVLFLLPALLVLFDKVIEKTTWKPNFYERKEDK